MDSFSLAITDCSNWGGDSNIPVESDDKKQQQITRIELGPINTRTKSPFATFPPDNLAALITEQEELDLLSDNGIANASVLLSATDGHSMSLVGRNRRKQLRHLDGLCEIAREKDIPIRCYLMCAFSCPFEGQTATHELTELCARLIRYGCADVVLVDNEGTADKNDLQALFNVLAPQLPKARTGFYFSEANSNTEELVKAATEYGVRKFCGSSENSLILGSKTKTAVRTSYLLGG